ncbi:MAG: nucleotidyltransferase domain-containing protein, partial [Candidatus Woesearchaeota archaeon]|nr:nucleotidyltransferase domain-containing protein [Candidatus Woesearchaeota archaeon]
MITLLQPGYRKIMQLFYKEKNAVLHLREIARRTKLHGPSTTKFLKDLEQNNILVAKKEIHLKNYRLQQSTRSYVFFTAFDVERFEQLPSIRKNAIRIYLQKLQEKPLFALLFGSTAKKTYNEESDIDILLITNKNISTKTAEKEADAITAMNIKTFQMTYNDF